MKRNSRGFTLIELLVVVAIIALLVSILLPSLSRAREMARNAVCLANMKGVVTGLHMYTNDNKDMFPFSAYDADDPADGTANGDEFEDREGGAGADSGWGIKLKSGADLFLCPSHLPAYPDVRMSYSINGNIAPAMNVSTGTTKWTGSVWDTYKPWTVSVGKIKDPETALLAETWMDGGWGPIRPERACYTATGNMAFVGYHRGAPAMAAASRPPIAWTHSDHVNIAAVGGSARGIMPKDTHGDGFSTSLGGNGMKMWNGAMPGYTYTRTGQDRGTPGAQLYAESIWTPELGD